MALENRKNVALIMGMLQNDFSKEILNGAIKGAEETNVNLFIFPIGIINVKYADFLVESYDNQFDILKDFLKSNAIDAAIVEYASITSLLDNSEKKEFLKTFGDIPLVLLSEKADGYPYIICDNASGLDEVVRHLICDCKLKKIGYVSGPKNNQDANERLRIYQEAVNKYGKDIDEKWIAYGNFSVFCEDVIEELLLLHPDVEAIVCANDNMASATYEVLRKHGLEPGKDIYVTGYDDSPSAVYLEPQLTTVKTNIDQLSYKAMLYLRDQDDNNLAMVHSVMMSRDSSGCSKDNHIFIDNKENLKKQRDFLNKKSEFEFNLSNVTSAMINMKKSIDSQTKTVLNIVKRMDYTSAYLFLNCNQSDCMNSKFELVGYLNEDVIQTMESGSYVYDENSIFNCECFPGNRRYNMLVLPIYFEKNHYGFLMTESDKEYYQSSFQLAMQLGSTYEIMNIMEKMEETQLELQLASEAKGHFLANMSHELRTPINAILGMNEMILRENQNDVIGQYAIDVQNASKSLLSIVNDILDFSKIESGKMELVPDEYDFGDMVINLVNMIYKRADDKGLGIELDIDNSIPKILYGDGIRIQQVVLNLLTNAVKYTEKGTVTLKIEKYENSDGIELRFSIKDTGIGIKEEDLPKLFEKFERIEEKRNKSIEGTGLGMSIVAGFLELMNSKMDVQSEYGVGSVFAFSVIQQVVDDIPIGDINQLIGDKRNDYTYRKRFVAPKASILVVDDNAMNRKVFCNLLKLTEAEITEAKSGYECIELVSEKKFDIIFLDHMMPELDGIETLKELFDNHNFEDRKIPVIALTANAISGAKEIYLSAGFDNYLSKPINSEQLEQMIIDYLPEELVVAKEKEELEMSDCKDDTLLALSELSELNLDYARLFNADSGFLVELIRDFYYSMEKEANELSNYYEQIKKYSDNFLECSESVKQYRVKVHSMKTSAGMIGAVSLSGVAKMLEMAAIRESVETIMNVTPVFLESWDELNAELKEIFTQEDFIGNSVLDVEELDKYFNCLILAMDDMDIDLADEAMESILQYAYPEEVKDVIISLHTAVENLDGDEVLETINRVKKML